MLVRPRHHLITRPRTEQVIVLMRDDHFLYARSRDNGGHWVKGIDRAYTYPSEEVAREDMIFFNTGAYLVSRTRNSWGGWSYGSTYTHIDCRRSA